MLLSETIKIKWNGATIEWYKNKGYTYTKLNDEFEIKTQDLPSGSEFKVKVMCDNTCCKNTILIRWKYYIKRVDGNGKFYCKECNKAKFKKEDNNKKSKQNISFEHWCLENNRQDELERWDYELNDCKPSEISYGSSCKKYYFKCPRGIHVSELKSIANFTGGHDKNLNCTKCNSLAQWGIDNICLDFLEKYWDYEKNNELGIDPWEISKSTHKKLYIYCQENKLHGSFLTNGNKFTDNRKCPFCNSFASHKVHVLDSLGTLYPKIIPIWSNKNKKSPYEYAPKSQQKVWWKCEFDKHEDYKRKIKDSYDCEFRCPKCTQERTESFLQEKVRVYLESINNGEYTILHEHDCTIVPKNPKTKMPLPFDNEIKELKLIIEVHGLQHYSVKGGYHITRSKRNNTTPEKELHYQQIKDRYKRIYTKSAGYDYLEISYSAISSKNEWKTLIDSKISEILHNKKLNKVS